MGSATLGVFLELSLMLLLGSCIFTKIPALLDCGYIPTWSGDPTDLKIALNTPNNLLDALGLVPGVYSS